MKKFIKTYNGQGIEDDGGYVSEECKVFFNEFKKYLKGICKTNGYELLKFNPGHYFCSAFLGYDDKVVYVNYDVPRNDTPINAFASDPFFGVLIRRAKDVKDYRGMSNHFTSLADLENGLRRLFCNE